ncbi:uncharacterized protein LOC112589595 [Harpegnathos saltator]|uniref:uncharacterized protein LOC112589595 n=1 Tax=Harpegnathos saltator TaxID=610380 RepID=UPI000DBEEF67|nr:uncharacterized protein LOC112589595 [Harpegnathos saltator]
MSVVLYGAPVWVEAFAATQRAQVDLRRIQRRIAIRVVSGYRTVSYVAATLLARMPPFDILAASRRRMYERARDLRPYRLWTSEAVAEARAAEELLVRRQWLLQLRAPGLPSVRVRDAILPEFNLWLDRPNRGGLTFHVTQLLTGHGVFAEFLYKIGKYPSPQCLHCGDARDDAQHTLQHYVAWRVQREELKDMGHFYKDSNNGCKIS